MTREQAEAFAAGWIAAWNARDVEALLASFAEEVELTSPRAREVVGVATVRGKTALRAYWTAALSRARSLRFTLDRVLRDAETGELAIVYTRETNGEAKRVSESLRFGPDGRVVAVEVFHGALP
ncbi:MAG TPA: nuclear transport factor 2 family protein [Polyangia bacterium]|nr:nuclear transport factor 2 family protein [Polyangia bacterium]